ncbi:unnamed protein product [Candida verbasci]|uniref:Uncharacterized protein n=1 Tax=Candida verbasci TaxID=1227364 RepID=A0A9W4TUA4_9ASCO|nr:unnamed protein product [Candida verbasci]
MNVTRSTINNNNKIWLKYYSTTNTKLLISNAQENLYQLLEENDRSSYIISHYIPEPCRNSFLAIRAFNFEINKINQGGSNSQSIAYKASNQLSNTLGASTSDLKFKFWSDLLLKVFTSNSNQLDFGEPIAILLKDGLNNNLNLDLTCFQKFLQTRRLFIKNNGTFKSINDICSYGEGTYSQLNYLTQGLLLSSSISPSSIELLENSKILQNLLSDISAHIGQATAIGSMIIALQYYAKSRNQIILPIDLMNENELSQEELLKLFQGYNNDNSNDIKEKLKNIVFAMATTANDHLLSASDKLNKSKLEIKEVINKVNNGEINSRLISGNYPKWRGDIPDALFIPFMINIPTNLYLKKLEKYDFDVFNSKLHQKEWRLAWTSFKNYYRRSI